MLTETQKHQFETLGFLCLKNFIPPAEMQTYIDAFDGALIKANGGKAWDKAPKRHQVFPFYRFNPPVYNRLLDNEKICAVLEDLIGEDFVFTVSEGIHHFGGTRWHHDDISPEGHTHLKVVLFLNPVRANTGCLSVLPGTHFKAYRERMEKYGGEILPLGKDVPGTHPIEADPGDAVVFNVKLYHAAFGDGVERKGIYVNYMQKPRTTAEAAYITHLYHRDGGYYTPELFEGATPKRMRMLAFLKAACYDVA
jgi:hypothetical protein